MMAAMCIIALLLGLCLLEGRLADDIDNSEVILTPWWDLVAYTGETLVLQCGVFTGQDSGSAIVQWLDPHGNPSADVTRQDALPPDYLKPSAYAVTTLKIPDVVLSDGGVYTCAVNRTSRATNETALLSRNITLTVLSADRGCGFEGPDMCGWRVDNTSSVQWHRHKADDRGIIDRTKGPRYDHTFGPSSQQGHFLDVDVGHVENPNKNSSALLFSPFYNNHTDFRCLQFWYLFEGRDQESLTVSIRGNVSSTSTLDQITDSQGGAWRLRKINIPPQAEGYQVVMDVVTCTDKCKNAVTALDDVTVTESKCPESDAWPESALKVRLTGGSVASEGRVEVQHEGQWGSVCSRKFGNKEARVICRILGFLYADVIRNATQFGTAPEGQIIWLQRLACTGKEHDLGSCLSKSEHWAETDCTPAEDAGVICSNEAPVPTIPTSSMQPPAPSLPTAPSPSTTILPTTTFQPPSPPLATLNSSTTTLSPSSFPMLASSSVPANSSSLPTSPSSTTPSSPPPSTSNGSATTSSEVSSFPTIRTTTRNSSAPAGSMVSFKPEVQDSGNNNAGVAIGVIIALAVAASVLGVMLYKNRKKGKKNAYITFGNPSYSRENLPANDFNLDSPLTLSSSGYTVLA